MCSGLIEQTFLVMKICHHSAFKFELRHVARNLRRECKSSKYMRYGFQGCVLRNFKRILSCLHKHSPQHRSTYILLLGLEVFGSELQQWLLQAACLCGSGDAGAQVVRCHFVFRSPEPRQHSRAVVWKGSWPCFLMVHFT